MKMLGELSDQGKSQECDSNNNNGDLVKVRPEWKTRNTTLKRPVAQTVNFNLNLKGGASLLFLKESLPMGYPSL